MRRFFIAGNWKMNKTASEAGGLVEQLVASLPKTTHVSVAIAPPFTALAGAAQTLARLGSPIALAAQNVFWEEKGAFTGEISAPMLKDLGCRYGLVGHSERRHILGETDEAVNKKVQALLRQGLTPILCVGETKAQRQAQQTDDVVGRQLLEGLRAVTAEQLARIVIAYEPVWAIGTGDAATPDQATAVHRHIRRTIASQWGPAAGADAVILYGGSVTAANVAQFLASPEVNGALVGGACLDPVAFAKIVDIAEATV